MLVTQETQDISTPSGLMRTYIYRPEAQGQFPSIIFLFRNISAKLRLLRAATILAGHGLSCVLCRKCSMNSIL